MPCVLITFSCLTSLTKWNYVNMALFIIRVIIPAESLLEDLGLGEEIEGVPVRVARLGSHCGTDIVTKRKTYAYLFHSWICLKA